MRREDLRRARQARQDSSQTLTNPPTRSCMPSLFNTIRTCIYVSVFVFTLICLGMAGQFLHVLAATDLTRFVPFAIFVCSASLLVITALLGFSLVLRGRNPISTRMELGSLAFAGILWLALGSYLTSSESQTADVECFSSEDDTTPLDDSAADFHTEQYQAMYHVLMAFALINAILVLFSALTLLILAIRRHKKGDTHMWYGPVTSCAWFKDYANGGKPVQRTTSRRQPPILPGPGGGAGAIGHHYRTEPKRHASSRSRQGPRREVPREKPLMRERDNYRQGSGQSSLIGSMTSNEFDSGGMVNPNRGKPIVRQ